MRLSGVIVGADSIGSNQLSTAAGGNMQVQANAKTAAASRIEEEAGTCARKAEGAKEAQGDQGERVQPAAGAPASHAIEHGTNLTNEAAAERTKGTATEKAARECLEGNTRGAQDPGVTEPRHRKALRCEKVNEGEAAVSSELGQSDSDADGALQQRIESEPGEECKNEDE